MLLTKEIEHSVIDGAELIGYFNLDQITIEIRKDQVLYAKVKSNCQLNMDDIRQIEELMDSNYPGQQFFNLFDFPSFSNLDSEVRDWASDKSGNSRTLADAIVIYSLPQRMIANFYLKVNKPPKPTKIFSTMEDALVWLKSLYN